MAVDYLLKIEGAEGESKIKGHEGEIDVLSWSWGMTQSGTMHVGGGGGKGKVSVQDISVTKNVDKASPLLIKMCCTGEHFETATLYARKAGKDPLEYLKVTMTKVLISSINTGGTDAEEGPIENLTLNFKAFEVDYVPQKDDGSGDADIIFSFDIAADAEG